MHTTSVELQDGLAIMRQRLEQLAAGDIRSHVDTHESNILHQLFTDFNICMDQLTALIAEAAYVSTLTNDIGSSINAATIQIAQSMEEQSALISGVASAAEEMTSNLSESSTNTMYATNIARECSDSAKNSGAIVRESITSLKNMVDSITGISTIIHELELKSTKIEDILVVIREIAAQTNLLALNAAIEAARAGEQGRGFAVVADEVRKLAERTQRETQEVADVVKGIRMETHNAVEAINTTVTEVDRGRTSSEDASAAIDQILSQTEQVFALVNNINEISKQQEVASSEVARSITSISDASQLATQSTHGISNDTTKLLLASRTLHSLLQKFSTGQGVNVIEQDTSDAPTIIHTSQLVKSQQYMPVVNSTQKHALLL
ncbi:MAG: hypothetical protein JNL32_15150 [Candidatus Kapabacteria bacterium]|nr:hypothetical protein [Candidatus Kapabacteria bacterium]